MTNLEKIGKDAAARWNEGGDDADLTDAVVQTVKGSGLGYEQLRRVCEFANREALTLQKTSSVSRMTQTIRTAKPDEVADRLGTEKKPVAVPSDSGDSLTQKTSAAPAYQVRFPDALSYANEKAPQLASHAHQPESVPDEPKVSSVAATAVEMVHELADAGDTLNIRMDRLGLRQTMLVAKLSSAINGVVSSGEANIGEALAVAKYAFDQQCRATGYEPLTREFNDMTENLAIDLVKTASAESTTVAPRNDLFEFPVFIDHPLMHAARGLAKIAAARRIMSTSLKIAEQYRSDLVVELGTRPEGRSLVW